MTSKSVQHKLIYKEVTKGSTKIRVDTVEELFKNTEEREAQRAEK